MPRYSQKQCCCHYLYEKSASLWLYVYHRWLLIVYSVVMLFCLGFLYWNLCLENVSALHPQLHCHLPLLFAVQIVNIQQPRLKYQTTQKLCFWLRNGNVTETLSPFVPDSRLSVTSSVNGGLFSATWPGCQPLPQITRPWSCRSTSRSTDFPVLTGSAARAVRPHGRWVDHVRTIILQPTYGVHHQERSFRSDATVLADYRR